MLWFAVAIYRPTQEGGMLYKQFAPLAVDGDKNTCARVITVKGTLAWWRVILDDIYFIDKIVVYFVPKSTGWLFK